MTVFEELGPLALASRLKQLSESLSKDVAQVYESRKIPFEPRWFTLFWVLHHQQHLTITELARELRQTHAAIVQLSNLLEKKGLLLSKKDLQDERRRQVSLSNKGKALFEQVMPVLGAIKDANQDLLQYTAPDFLDQLKAIEQALDQRSMLERILEQLYLSGHDLLVKAYETSDYNLFREFYLAWIEQAAASLATEYLPILQSPEEAVLKQGGMIFLALQGQELVGVAVLQKGAEAFVLLPLAVQQATPPEELQRLLLERCQVYALAQGAKALFAYLNPAQAQQLNLYVKQGYEFMQMQEESDGQWLRAGLVKMQRQLQG